jgi:hypothetical protein
MKKHLIVILMTILLILVGLTTIKVSADMQKPVFTEGDYWEYDIELFNEDLETIITGNSRIEVHGNQTITINGSQYDARIVTDNSELIGYFSNNTLNLSSKAIKYYREDDNSLMIFIKNSAMYGFSEIVYNYPFVGLNWPIRLGFSWQRTAMRTYSNYTDSTSGEFTYYYDCIGKSEINTSAGFFECYEIKIRSVKDDSFYTISYRSPDTGYFEVKSEEYQDGVLTRRLELKSYKYTQNLSNEEEESNDNNDGAKKNEDTNGGDKTPGFEFIIYIFAITLLLWFKKHKLIF